MNNDARRNFFMAGESLKMDEVDSALIISPCRSTLQERDKENVTPKADMKTVAKLGISPFGSAKKGFKIMSDDEVALVNSKSKNKNSKRRSLAPLQQTTEGKGTLTGNGRDSLSIKEAFKRKKEPKNEVIKLDVPSVPENQEELDVVHQQMQKQIIKEGVKETDPDEELAKDALELMRSTENVDDSYWKTIAEERRIALEETLAENETLYDKYESLEQENENLKKQVSELECYKLLYRNLLAATHKSTEETVVDNSDSETL